MQFPSQVSEASVHWRNELLVLQERRSELANQLEILNNRRGQLADQLGRTESSLRAAPQARLAELDARIAIVEQDALRTDNRITELLANAPVEARITPPPTPRAVDAPGLPPMHYAEVPTGWDPKDVLEMAVVGSAGFAVLTAILCRLAWLSARRRFRAERPPENPQLQQAVDAIAIEVERISEGQRFVTALMSQRQAEQREPRSPMIPQSAPRPKTVTPV